MKDSAEEKPLAELEAEREALEMAIARRKSEINEIDDVKELRKELAQIKHARETLRPKILKIARKTNYKKKAGHDFKDEKFAEFSEHVTHKVKWYHRNARKTKRRMIQYGDDLQAEAMLQGNIDKYFIEDLILQDLNKDLVKIDDAIFYHPETGERMKASANNKNLRALQDKPQDFLHKEFYQAMLKAAAPGLSEGARANAKAEFEAQVEYVKDLLAVIDETMPDNYFENIAKYLEKLQGDIRMKEFEIQGYQDDLELLEMTKQQNSPNYQTFSKLKGKADLELAMMRQIVTMIESHMNKLANLSQGKAASSETGPSTPPSSLSSASLVSSQEGFTPGRIQSRDEGLSSVRNASHRTSTPSPEPKDPRAEPVVHAARSQRAPRGKKVGKMVKEYTQRIEQIEREAQSEKPKTRKR